MLLVHSEGTKLRSRLVCLRRCWFQLISILLFCKRYCFVIGRNPISWRMMGGSILSTQESNPSNLTGIVSLVTEQAEHSQTLIWKKKTRITSPTIACWLWVTNELQEVRIRNFASARYWSLVRSLLLKPLNCLYERGSSSTLSWLMGSSRRFVEKTTVTWPDASLTVLFPKKSEYFH